MLKNFLKDRLLIAKVRHRFSPAVQIGQRELYHRYRDNARNGVVPAFNETGFRVFSQFEEDGKLLFLFALIGMDVRSFVDIGADDGVNSNAANLLLNFGWHGLFIDASARSVARGKRFFSKYPHPWSYRPTFTQAKVTRENVDHLIAAAGLKGEVGLLSIDIDGNDYWVWDAISVISPRVVVIETHIEFGLRNIVVPYDPAYAFPGKHPVYHGASPVAMVRLAERKGYRLVGANDLGANFFFVRNDLVPELLPAVEVASVLQHPDAQACQARFAEVEHLPFLEG